MEQMRAGELARWISESPRPAPQLLDVREPWEFGISRIADSISMPMREVLARHRELDPSRPVVCICHHGARSMQVAFFLEHQGFERVINLAGGIHAWSHEVDPDVPTY
ncbi:MAG: sulfurtransferase [Burkholderiales bacterium]|nr:MAG: sulfurtransferase [Burkholderiales bacterium]